MYNKLPCIFLLVITFSCSQESPNNIQFQKKMNELNLGFEDEKNMYAVIIDDSLNRIKHFSVLSKEREFFKNYSYDNNGTLTNLDSTNELGKFNIEFETVLSYNQELIKSNRNSDWDEKYVRPNIFHHIVYLNNRDVYLGIYENGEKTYNSFNLFEIEKMVENKYARIKLRNDFPFQGELEFNLNSNDSIVSINKSQNSEYDIKVFLKDANIKRLEFEISIIPSENDTLLYSKYIQIVKLN
jgi:hypothetical protein